MPNISTNASRAGEILTRIPPRISETRERTNPWWIVSSLLLIAGLAVLYLFNPAQHGFYPRCLFYTTTGLLCPGCGTLRALHQLLHGHIEAAFRFNALIVSLLPFLPLACVQAVRNRSMNKPAMAWVHPNWLWILLIILILFGILRNLPGAAHYFLAPL